MAIIFAAVFLLVYLPAVELEEQHLRDIFPSYEHYASRVSRFVPKLKRERSDMPFSWSLYRRNEEHKALIGFLIAAGWLAWKWWFAGVGK